MKKLLSLLSVLTISGTAVPTTTAVSSYQNQDKLNRIKRNINFDTLNLNGEVTAFKALENKPGGIKIKNNNLYIATTNGSLYYYYVDTKELKEINGINEVIKEINIALDGTAYFRTIFENLYSLSFYSWEPIKMNSDTINFLYLDKLIKIKNLNIINNSDNAILNELNYLNPNLDISQLEVINKTDISATIKAKSDSDKYFNENKIYYIINNQQNKIINLDELIKKGIFLNFRDNKRIIIKEIININKNNLIYSNVTATKSIEPIYDKNNKSICFGTTILFHNLPEKQNMKTPSCKYTKETSINTQITTGLSKEETNSNTSDMKHNWSFELGVNVHGEAGVWPFAKVSTDINSNIETGGEYGFSETKTLSNRFDFSNNKTDEFKESSEVQLPSQEIEVKPNQKIKVTTSLEEVFAQVILNLKQNIYGEINAKIITLNNEEKTITLSIKEIMQKLKQYDILPQEITINNDDSITFNGKASRSLKQGFDGNIEFHEVN